MGIVPLLLKLVPRVVFKLGEINLDVNLTLFFYFYFIPRIHSYFFVCLFSVAMVNLLISSQLQIRSWKHCNTNTTSVLQDSDTALTSVLSLSAGSRYYIVTNILDRGHFLRQGKNQKLLYAVG